MLNRAMMLVAVVGVFQPLFVAYAGDCSSLIGRYDCVSSDGIFEYSVKISKAKNSGESEYQVAERLVGVDSSALKYEFSCVSDNRLEFVPPTKANSELVTLSSLQSYSLTAENVVQRTKRILDNQEVVIACSKK
jgi:hypothetical protein